LHQYQVLPPTLVRYLVVGVVNTAVGLSIIYFCMWFGGLGNAISNAIGYGVGICTSFILNNRYTFRHEGEKNSAFLRFLIVTAAAYLANLAVVLQAVYGLGLNPYYAQAIGVAPYTAVGYLGSKFFVFRRKPDVDA
jgi:putative flippase GtrA